MTKQGNNTEEVSEEKPIPAICGEEDEPLFLPSQLPENRNIDKDLVETDDIGKEMARFRYKTGRTVLYVAMAAMGTFVIIDLFAAHKNLERGCKESPPAKKVAAVSKKRGSRYGFVI